MGGEPRDLALFKPKEDGRAILERAAAKGLADELCGRGNPIIDGGKAHDVAFNARDELTNYPAGS